MNANQNVEVLLARLDKDFKGYRRLMTTLVHLHIETRDERMPRLPGGK